MWVDFTKASGKAAYFAFILYWGLSFFTIELSASEGIADLNWRLPSPSSCQLLLESFKRSEALLEDRLESILKNEPAIRKLFGNDSTYTADKFSQVLLNVKAKIKLHFNPTQSSDSFTTLFQLLAEAMYSLPLKDAYLLTQYKEYGEYELFALIYELAGATHIERYILDSLDDLFSKIIVRHPAQLRERRLVLAAAIQHKYLRYMDELLGIPRLDTEKLERVERDSTHLSLDHINMLGLAQPHDYWFSSYPTLYQVLNSILASGSHHVVELGSGTGRLGLLLGFLLPEVQYTGVELVASRIQAAQKTADRWQFANIHFKEQDLMSDESYPIGDFYYLYGPTNERSINASIFRKIRSMLQDEFLSAILVNSHWDSKGLETELAPWPKPFAILSGYRRQTDMPVYLIP